jgi:sugar lactone lactonase YvrE
MSSAPSSSASPGARNVQPSGALPAELPFGKLETVATIDTQMPTGIAVADDGRVFLSFPRWSDPIEYTLGVLRGGRPAPYPDLEFNKSLVSVQAVYADGHDNLWVLDTGSASFGPVQANGAKLVQIDLKTNKAGRAYTFAPDVVLPTSYVNDVRVDLSRGKSGTAYITDSSANGPNAIIVLDLESRTSWRRLEDHPSVKADPMFLAFVEGQPLYVRSSPGATPKPFGAGADGIALSKDKKTLWYSPLGSRHLYSVPTDTLTDRTTTDDDLAKLVVDHGDKGASDGLETDDNDRLYIANYEENAIERRNPDGTFEPVAFDVRLVWPDTLSVSSDGYLYVTANQLDRQAMFHEGKDLRQKPFAVFRLKIDGSRLR